MTEFQRERPPFRLVETHRGDDLQAIAARELGDANRWPELVWLNNLVPPFITDEELGLPGVLVTGDLIRVPAPVGLATDEEDIGGAFERDCRLVSRMLVADADGDLDVVAGSKNLVQQLTHRLNTPRGQMRRHMHYGNLAWRLLGTVGGPTAGALANEHCRAALLADYRVASVRDAVVVVEGDAIKVTAKAEAVSGTVIDVTAGSPSS